MAQFEEKSLMELADSISSHAKALQDYIDSNQLPKPVLGAGDDGSERLDERHSKIKHLRFALRSAAKQLDALAAGSTNWMLEQLVFPLHDVNAHRILYEYRIPQYIPAHGSITYADLSKKCGLSEDKLTRILRYELTNFMFIEPMPGHIAHNSVSRHMADNEAFDWVGHITDDCFGGVTRTVEAFRKWGSETTAGNQTGVQIYYDTDKDIFTYFGDHEPSKSERFGSGNKWVTSTAATSSALYDCEWKKLGKVTLVDLGGSFGYVSAAIAREAPEMTFIVQDLESCISKAPPPPADVADRITMEVQDFFTPQRRSDMDIVFMSRVLRDWPDHDCQRILENLVPSMKKGCRLIINDLVKLSPYESTVVEQKHVCATDLHTMAIMNTRERSDSEWKSLVNGGSGGKLAFEWSTSGMISFIKT